VLITASDKDVTIHLLNAYGFDFVNMGTYGNTVLRKIATVPLMDLRMVHAVWKFHPEVFLGIASSRAAHTAFVLRKKSIVFDDSEHKGQLWAYLRCYRRHSLFKKILAKSARDMRDITNWRIFPPFYAESRVLDELGLSGRVPFRLAFFGWGIHDLGLKFQRKERTR
jgi:hypothetical protein